MITRLQISNYRSLGPDVTLSLGRLSALVGPNGSGKSNTLDALSFVRDAIVLGLPAAIARRGGLENVRRRCDGPALNIRLELELTLGQGQAVYGFELDGDKRYRVKAEWATIHGDGEVVTFERDGMSWRGPEGTSPRVDEQSLVLTSLGGDLRFKPLADFLAQLATYAISPTQLRHAQQFSATTPMSPDGENWLSSLRDVLESSDKDELVNGLHKLTGTIEDVRVTVLPDHHLYAEFKQSMGATDSALWIPSAFQSDGTLRVACLFVALLRAPHGSFIGIEEPELTVHPAALPLLYDYLHQASSMSQVVITTHSPVLLDAFDVERDSVFVVECVNGATIVGPLAEHELEPVRQRLLTLGELMLVGGLEATPQPSDEG